MLTQRRVVLGTGLLLVALWILPVSLQIEQAAPVFLQSNPTVPTLLATVTPVPALPQAESMPCPTPEAVSYPQMLAVYKEVLETSKWIMTAILGALTASGVGALYLFQHGLKGIGEVQAKANELKSELEANRKQSEELRKSNEDLMKKLEKQAEETRVLREQAKSAERDIGHIVPRLETLADVDTYAMRLFSADSETSRVARRTLIELSKDNDPVVRRECVRVFGAMPSYPGCFVDPQDHFILSRLREMALTDPERGVQLEARLTLKKLGVDFEDE